MTSTISWNLAGGDVVKWTLECSSPAVIGFTECLLIWSCAGGGNKADHQKSSALNYQQSLCKGGRVFHIYYSPREEHHFCAVLLHF